MKPLFDPFLFAAMAVVLFLPSATTHSQLAAPLPADPLAAIQTLQKSNDDLLKRQDATLKTLTDLTNTANEVRIFSRRG